MSLQLLRTQSARSVCEQAQGTLPPKMPPASSPQRAAPRLSQTLLIHFPLSTFPLKKRPGVTSESAGQASDVLGAIRRHCCQTRPGAAYELAAANAIHKINSKTAAVCGKWPFSFITLFYFHAWYIFFSQISSHDRSLLLAQLLKKKIQTV